MSLAAIQAMITTFGNRIAAIIFDNQQTIFIGYGRNIIDDITFEKHGDVDFIVIPNTARTDDPNNMITWKTYHPIECIQDIVVMDEKYAGFRPDPIHLK